MLLTIYLIIHLTCYSFNFCNNRNINFYSTFWQMREHTFSGRRYASSHPFTPTLSQYTPKCSFSNAWALNELLKPKAASFFGNFLSTYSSLWMINWDHRNWGWSWVGITERGFLNEIVHDVTRYLSSEKNLCAPI